MKIHGLQKLTLLDYPGHTACTVFLAGCDLRCPWCHNADLLDASSEALMEEEELLTFLKKRQGLLDGVAFTGGEPLLYRELPELMEKIRALGYQIKLDTNGCHPDRLRELLQRKLLDYVAMDIKNSPDRYAETAGVARVDMGKIYESISIIMSQATDYEFRTTVVSQFHDEESFQRIGIMIRGAKRYYLQSFTDRDTVPYAGFSAPSAEQMHRYADILKTHIPSVELRGI